MRPVDGAKVGIYIRWSTEDQGQGHTLAIQSEACRHYCLSQGWTVRDDLIYVDDGWSGGTLERPALARLRSEVAAGAVEAVVVYKLDRLSRNIKDVIALVLDEWDGRCVLRSTMEPIDTASDTGKLTFTLLSSFADFERSTIRARTLSGKRKNAEQGRNAGAPYPYGYERGDTAGAYRAVEAEAAVVRQIFQLYLQGLGCKPIAARLNAMGALCRPDGPGRPRLSPGAWSGTAVLRILQNPVYTGQLVYSRRSRNTRRAKDGGGYYLANAPAAVIRVTSPHIPPIVDGETFARAAEIRQSRHSPRTGRRAVGSPHLLGGLLWCRCGHAAVGRRARGGRRVYWCSGRKNKGAAVCQAGQIPAEVLERLVLERVAAIYGAATVLPPAQAVENRRHTVEQLAAALGAEVRQVQQAQLRLDLDYTAGRVTGEAFQHLHDTLAARAGRLAAGLADLRRQLAEPAEAPPAEAGRPVTLAASFGGLGMAQQKLVLAHLIRRIAVYREPGSRQVAVEIDWAGTLSVGSSQ